MKIEWLETVMAIANCGSFSEAAELIPCAQSSVSRQVKCAEDALGVTIFKRSSNSNKVSLTPEGAALLPMLENILNDCNQLFAQAQSLRAQRKVPLALGVHYYAFSAANLANLTSQLYLQHPEIVLSITEVPEPIFIEYLAAKKVDAILSSRVIPTGQPPAPAWDNSTLTYIPLGSVALSLACSDKLRFSNCKAIDLASVKDQNFLFYMDAHKAYDLKDKSNRHCMFLNACHECGFDPKITVVDRNYADVKLLMAANGLGVCPSSIPTAFRAYPGVQFIPIKNAPYYIEYYLLFLSSRKKAVFDTLISFLRERIAPDDIGNMRKAEVIE